MHGNGNDYVYIDAINNKITDLSMLSTIVSNRNFGIGSDGLIVAAKSNRADLRMIMYNADGSRGAMCGNGIRCLAKFAYDNKLVDKKELDIETDSGIKHIKLEYVSLGEANVTVDMGAPIFEPKKIPVKTSCKNALNYVFKLEGNNISLSCLSMGNPHAVSFIDEWPRSVKNKFIDDSINHENLSIFNPYDRMGLMHRFNIEKFGKIIQAIDVFTDGVNAEAALILDRQNIAMRVYERGSAETLSCGTGCCATAVSAMKKGLVEQEVYVHTLGGKLKISWDIKKNSPVMMQGPAITVFDGELNESMNNDLKNIIDLS